MRFMSGAVIASYIPWFALTFRNGPVDKWSALARLRTGRSGGPLNL